MIQDGGAYAKSIQDFHAHVAQVGVSFSDDGVTLICTREECMENVQITKGTGWRRAWWQRDVPYMCTPETLVDLRNQHVKGEW
jgi:hypothetical protein